MPEICRYSLLASFAEHRQALMRFLVRRLGNPALAEAVARETWRRAAISPGGAVSGTPRSHLFRIATDMVIDHQRHVGQRMESRAAEEAAFVADSQPSSENVVLYPGEFARLVRVIDGLPARCREVFLLCRVDGLSHADIADRLGICRNVVVSHMVNAMAMIEREMDLPR